MLVTSGRLCGVELEVTMLAQLRRLRLEFAVSVVIFAQRWGIHVTVIYLASLRRDMECVCGQAGEQGNKWTREWAYALFQLIRFFHQVLCLEMARRFER